MPSLCPMLARVPPKQRRPCSFTAALIAAALGLLLPASLFAAGPGLCRAREYPLFFCTLQNGKVAQVCALDDPPGDEYRAVTYRFGTPDHIELSLPENPTQFKRFAAADESVSAKSGEDDQLIRFKKGQYSYVLYAGTGSGYDLRGIAVFNGQKLLSNMPCTSPDPDLNIGISNLLHIGVPEEEENTAWMFWRQLLPASSAVRARKPPARRKH